MKKVIIGIMAFTILSPSDAIDSIYIEHLNGSLNEQDHSGSFNYDVLSYKGQSLKLSSSQSQIETSFYQGIFTSRHQDIELNYRFGEESALAGIQNISTSELNLSYDKNQSLTFETSGIEIKHTGGTQYLPQVSLKCRNNQKSIVSDIAFQCLSLAELKVPELQFDALSGKSMAKALSQNKALDKLENIKLYIFDHSFQMQFKAKFVFNWTVKSEGTIDFDEEKKLVSIYLRKAKVGIISLKGKILDEIRDANLESVRVDGNMIYIQL